MCSLRWCPYCLMKYRWAIHSRETGELSSLSTFHRKGWAINWHATFGDGSLFRTAMPHGVGLKLFLAQHFPFVPLRVQVCVVQHKTCLSLTPTPSFDWRMHWRRRRGVAVQCAPVQLPRGQRASCVN